MKTTDLSTFLENITYYISEAKKGAIFAYPTDTIYGIGGIATISVVEKINKIKQRPSGKHYSVIAPDSTWIEHFFAVGNNFEKKWQDKITQINLDHIGGLTYILPLKPGNSFPWTTIPENGVRMIHHPFQEFVQKLGEAFITTSLNISGSDHITSLDQIKEEQKNDIDYAIDAGELDGSSSRIVMRGTEEIIR